MTRDKKYRYRVVLHQNEYGGTVGTVYSNDADSLVLFRTTDPWKWVVKAEIRGWAKRQGKREEYYL